MGAAASAGKASRSGAAPTAARAGAAAPERAPAACPPGFAPTLSAGNQQILRALGVRAKLTVSAPGDPEEHEADRAANAFVAGEAGPSTLAAGRTAIRRSCAACEEDAPVRRKAESAGAPAAARAQGAMEASRGAALAPAFRRDYERFFRADLSGVRIHTDPPAQSAARTLSAAAFSRGSDVYFSPGRFQPASHEGQRLLAHELAHVVQQQRAPRDPQSVWRQGEVCEMPPETVGTFELDPALTDVAIPPDMRAHVRVSQPMIGGGRGLFRDRFVEIVRPVRRAQRLTAYAVPLDRVSQIGECTTEPVSRMLGPGDEAFTASGTIRVTRVQGDMVFTEQPNAETVAAGAAVFLETDAGVVVIDAGLQVDDAQYKPVLGAELGRQIGERTGGEPVDEAIIASVSPDGPALPYIAAVVGLRSVRATQDLYDDGTVSAVLAAQEEYRRWYEASLRERLTAERADWEATQPIAPNQGIRDRLWEAHLEATVAQALRQPQTTFTLATETQGVLRTGDDTAPPVELGPPELAPGEIPDVSDTQWEPVDDQYVFIYGGGQLAVLPSRGLVMRPVTARTPAATTVPAPTEVPSLLPGGPLGLGAVPARPVTPWMLLRTLGKQSHIVVRTNSGLALLIDAGGPRAISTRAFADASIRLGGVTAEAILVSHEHSDHVRQLLRLIEARRITPDKLVLSEAWGEVVEALRATTHPPLVDLGYGAEWTGPRIAAGSAPVISARVRSGAVDVDIYGLRDAHRDYAAARASEAAGGPAVQSSAGDRASLLYVFGNETSPNRTLFLGDFRGENIVELHRELGPERFRAALRNVRTVVGAGHHFSRAAGRTVGDVRGLELLVEATLVQNGELTILVQSRTGFAFDGPVTLAGPEGALLRYFVRLGARVVFVGAGRGGVSVDSSGGVSSFGTGVEITLGDPRVVAMYRRLDMLREARRTVAESAEFGPAALEMQGRSAAEIQAELDADIARLEGLARELAGQAGADLLDVRGPEEPGRGTSRARVRERQAFRQERTTAGRTADQILTDMAAEGPAERALSQPVRERLRVAVASGRSVALGVEFAQTPTAVTAAIEGLPAEQRSSLAQQYRELAELTGRLEGGLVPPSQRLEVLARAIALRDALAQALASTSGEGRGALEAELARVNDVVGRIEAGTVRHVEVGRDIQGRPTRTEYIRLRQTEAVLRGFHGVGRVLGAVMVVHTVSELGAVADDAARGELNLPEGALRVAHAAYGMSIGVRLARSTFRQAMAGTGPRVGGWEFALLAVLEIGAAAAADYDSTEERDAAILGTAIHSSVNLLCMYAGMWVMGQSIKLRHPYAVAAGMGLGLAISMAGETILSWLGLDDNVQRWTSFPPGEVTHVHQDIGAALREYRILIGTQELQARSDEQITGLGMSDPARVRALASSTGENAARAARTKEREITALFEDAYRRSRGSWVGLQILDEQAEEFTRLRRMAMSGRDDPGREALDARWRALDASVQIGGEDEAVVREMEQWEQIDEKRQEVASGLAERPVALRAVFESMEELQLMLDNARYRVDSPTRRTTRGVLRPRAQIPPGTPAYRLYVEMLTAREVQVAALHAELVRASGSRVDSSLSQTAMDPQSALARLRATRQSYDAQVAAAAAANPTLALPATWDDPTVLARTAVTAYRSQSAMFERLRLLEMTLQSAGRQAELALTIAAPPPPEAFRQLARAEIDAVPGAIFARRQTYGLVFPHELDTVLEERGVEEDAILAARMDAAFPRGGIAPTTPVAPPTETELEALHAGDLASVGRRITTTERQLGEVRRVIAPGRVWSPGDPLPSLMDYVSGRAPDIWNKMSRAIQYRQFALVNRSYRIADFSGINTYPSRTIAAGRTPIVAFLNETHYGCDSEYCFGGPLMYYRVIAVNADAVAELGPDAVYIAGFTMLSDADIEARLPRAPAP